VNGDACDDLLVGSGFAHSELGFASLYLSEQSDDHPSGCVLGNLPAVTFNPGVAERTADRNGRLGWTLTTGDVNGDCSDDLVLGQYNAPTSRGNVLVFFGDPEWSASSPVYLTTDDAGVDIEGGGSGDFLGFGVALGDVDGDGIQDLLATARDGQSPTTQSYDEGEIYIYPGLIDGSDCAGSEPGAPVFGEPMVGAGEPDVPSGRFGNRVAVVPDVDGDGINDVVAWSERARATELPWERLGTVFWRSSMAEGWDFEHWTQQTRPIADSADELGYATAAIGDVNGDGYLDFAVSAQRAGRLAGTNNYFAPHSSAGAVFVLFGGADGLREIPDLRLGDHSGHNWSDLFGNNVQPAGDFNGDGFHDFMVAAPYDDNHGNCSVCRETNTNIRDTGMIAVYYGHDGFGSRRGERDPLPTLSQPDHVICGPQVQYSRPGVGLAGGFDVNGDGLDDVVMSYLYFDGNRGVVWVSYGTEEVGEDGPGVTCMTSENEVGRGDASRDYFGIGVAGADLDGDGCAEILVGAIGDDFEGRSNSGAVHVYRGSGGPGCPAQMESFAFTGRSNDSLGYRVEALDDLTGDGVPDFAVSSNSYGSNNWSAVLIIDGSRVAEAMAVGEEGDVILLDAEYISHTLLEPLRVTGTEFGYAIDSLGDVDGDGLTDLLIGARFSTPESVLRRGLVYVYLSDENPQEFARPDVVIPGDGRRSDSEFGFSVAGGAIGNGDVAIIVGAFRAEWEGTEFGEHGEAYIGQFSLDGQ
jgi:hypothetical protein